jgi:replicative DNA helicase
MELDLEYFEQILAREAMTDAAYLNAIADYVNPEYFEDARIGKYFEIVKDFYEKRQTLPTLTEIRSYLTTDALKNGFKTLLLSFKELDKNLDKTELYENTEKFLKEKSVYHTMLSVAKDISDGKIDTSEILQKFEKCCSISLITERGFDLYSQIDDLIHDIENVESSIPSGWDWLDNAIGGGYREDGKALYVFAGQPNIGKSIFLGNIAKNIAVQNKSVLVITLEMSELLYAKRISSNITKIPLKDFGTSTKTLKRKLEAQREDTPSGKLLIKEFPPSTITPKQLSGFIKKLVDAGEKFDAIVIDYLNLLHSPVGTSSYERVKYICEQVRAMSYTFKCPIVSATQLNRSGYNSSNPSMESLSESSGIAATADVIVSIFQQEEDVDMGYIRIGMMKNRFGPRGMTQPMHIDYPILTIQDIADDNADQSDGLSGLSLLEKLAKS